MNRSGYTEDYDNNWELIMWRGAVTSSIYGRRGQAFLRELIEVLDAMPEKRLIANALESGGEVCAIGSVGRKRGIEMNDLDPEDYDRLSGAFNIAAALVREIEYVNDESNGDTPESRWQRVRDWAAKHLRAAPNGR